MAMVPDDVRRVLGLLENFRGPRPLRELFWTELEYDRAGDALSRRSWPGEVRELLAEDPLLLATAGEDGRFHVIYCRMQSPGLSLAAERQVVLRLLNEHPYTLFVFSNRAQDLWHLVNVKVELPREGGEPREGSRRRLVRRIAVSPGAPMRTAAERLNGIRLERLPGGREASPMAIQQALDEAFDVEEVTKEFYRKYRQVFERVEREIRGFAGEPERKRRFTQRLFHRLMFTAFVQKKGWLEFPDPGGDGYLWALWTAYRAEGRDEPSSRGDNFYRDRLLLLFEEVLNRSRELPPSQLAVIADLVGTGPYLNGGLFEEDELDRTPGVVVPDDALYFILHDLFGRFNFTVTEATPLEVEVAVDPEMLGKIFEELVTGRHESGSYFTPKPIVAYMCRAALKGYLRGAVTQEARDAVERFVDEHDASGLRDGEAVLQALREVKVCDPACGSGAYLLGMLHELLDLRAALFSTNGKLDPVSAYERKLEIIQKNIYGVDNDDFAVETARLRLWLSLVVDFERGDDGWVPPLPNLEFKIGQGDSLTAPLEKQLQLMDALARESDALRSEYMYASDKEEKKRLQDEIRRLQVQIAIWVHGAQVAGFDWVANFPEVVTPQPPLAGESAAGTHAAGRAGGFDIILANPPYVRMELFKHQKPTLRRNFANVHAERADLFVYFYARALDLLAPGGTLVFISANKWLRAGYGAKLRTLLGATTQVEVVLDFADLPVFESADAYPMIIVARKEAPGDHVPGPLYARAGSLDPPYPDLQALLAEHGRRLPPAAVRGSEWQLAGSGAAPVVGRMRAAGVPLGEYARGGIVRGVVSGCNDAFVIDDAARAALVHRDPRSAEVIKPLCVGREIRRWHIEAGGRWLLYMHHGVDPARYPAVVEHLQPFRPVLEARATRQPWYELQQPQQRFQAQMEGPKIVTPDIAKELRFALDPAGRYVTNSAYFIPLEDYYLLAVLNSPPVEEFYASISAQIRGGYLRFFRQYVERIPIPRAGPRDREAIAELAHRCVDAGPSARRLPEWEGEIGERVAALYGLGAREAAA